MRIIIKFLFNIFIILSFSSCIKGNFKGLFSYYNCTKQENPNLLIKLDDLNSFCIPQNLDTPKIIITNGISLKKCINHYNNSIVYIWSPRCKGKLCVSLDIIQKICDEKGIELFIIAEYYDSENMKINHNLKRPILGIDTKYYKTNLTSRYLAEFIYDLTSNSHYDGRFLLFNSSNFLKSFKSIEEI